MKFLIYHNTTGQYIVNLDNTTFIESQGKEDGGAIFHFSSGELLYVNESLSTVADNILTAFYPSL